MNFNTAAAIRWMEILVSVSCLIQTLEFFKIRYSFGSQGVWRWETLKKEFRSNPMLEKFLNFLLDDSNFLIVLISRAVSSVILMTSSQPLPVFILIGSSLLISLRWRGTFNGGSDYMTFLVLAVLTLIHIFPDVPWIVSGALWYLALQTILSYFISGWIKVKNMKWRNGSGLAQILIESNYDVPARVRILAKNRSLSRISSWLVMIFECSFPLCLLSPVVCLVYLSAALLFHLANSYILGLNRFFWAWLAAYPAVYFCSLQVF